MMFEQQLKIWVACMQITRVNQFELAEGLDLTGVATNFLSCNISLALTIDNRSKVFGLYSPCPLVDIYFGRVPLVLSKVSLLNTLFKRNPN